MAMLAHQPQTEQTVNKVTTLQVCKLRPGRRYAFRLVCVLDIPPALTPPASPLTSFPVAFANPATVPGAPLAPKLGGRGRTNLTVGVDIPWVLSVGSILCRVVNFGLLHSGGGLSLKIQVAEMCMSTTSK